MRSKTLLLLLLCLSMISIGTACKDRAVTTVSNDIVVLIESPSKYYFQEGDAIEFAGSGTASAGDVAENNLEWTSSLDGVIGTGTLFAREDLSVGTHEIELSAVNQSGEVFTDTTTIEIYKRRARKRTAQKEEKWFRRINDPVDGGTYIEVHDGTIIDMSTGLMWEKSPDNGQRNFQGAVAHAKKLRLGGHKDWRVPTLHELRMISNISFSPKYRRMFNISESAVVHSAAICNVFETMNGHFWSYDTSNRYIMIAGKRYGHAVLYQFDFTVNSFRGTYTPYNLNKPGYVRCVRNADLKKWRKLLAKK
ncbi:MAG: hypothetical protein AMJ54_05805 [Deltaproteobacteria bacterium SG8_13]|nr:MAG: hypothetical protein AMJ54_05805 [Deltaproteobacteria bacterium SG8_13]